MRRKAHPHRICHPSPDRSVRALPALRRGTDGAGLRLQLCVKKLAMSQCGDRADNHRLTGWPTSEENTLQLTEQPLGESDGSPGQPQVASVTVPPPRQGNGGWEKEVPQARGLHRFSGAGEP